MDLSQATAPAPVHQLDFLWGLLNDTGPNGADIIDFLSQDPQLKNLFEASAGVFEGYTIQEHTLLVFEKFQQQYPLYQNHYRFEVPDDVRLLQLLKFTLALHDIGKPYAVAAGDKSRQHEFTVPILEKTLPQFGFSENEIKLAIALAGHDIMGDFIKGNIDLRETKEQLLQTALGAGMRIPQFAPLQFLFYVVDASAYPGLRHRIFTTTSDGRLIPNRSQFQKLWDAL